MAVLLGVPPVDGDPGAGWLSTADLEGAVANDSPVDLALVVDATAELMFVMSGEQFGRSTDTVRPVRAGAGCGCGGELVTFSWSSLPRYVCGCGSPSFVLLPGPVTAVGEVLVDGVALVAGDDYRLVDGQFLVRVGGSWPCCQDLTLPSTEPGTWRITFTHGPGIPAAGQLAARALGIEIAKAAAGSADCALAGRVQSVTRDGVSGVIVTDPNFLAEGRTGISITDLWLQTVAPLGRNRGGTISLPGALRGLHLEAP